MSAHTKEQHTGWRDENILVQDARRPFTRRVQRMLHVEGMAAISSPPSERRLAAGIDTLGYYTYPLLFYTAFPRVSLAQLRTLSVGGSYLFDYILCLDRMLDQSSLNDAGTTLLSGLLQREAMTLLYQLFPAGSAFWTYFDTYYAHFAQAVLRERACHHHVVRPYTEAELEFIYAGKPALAKSCIAALALIDGSEAGIAALSASHDAFYVGFQLVDDLLDWRLDYLQGHYSYPLTLAFQQGDWRKRVESRSRPDLAEVEAWLHASGAAEQSLALALHYLEHAEACLGAMPEGSWLAAIRRMRQNVAGFRFPVAAPPEPPPMADAGESLWLGSVTTLAVPLAQSWRPWLDLARLPQSIAPQILAVQQQYLAAVGGSTTIGIALAQVGLAIAASLVQFPDQGLDAHLGMSMGELSWCRHNVGWLDAMLALSIDEPAWAWTPEMLAPSVPLGWLPLTVGRYLGYRLVELCRHSGMSLAQLTPLGVLEHYRRQLAV